METTLAIPEKFKTLSNELNSTVMGVINSETIAGFEKAYTVAVAIDKLKASLTGEYMKPIMALQGNRLGFKTDKDKENGYPEDVVRKCLIEAVLMGLQPYGNEFNIIAGNTYATKEGLGAVLKKFKGLSYEIMPLSVNMTFAKDTAEANMKVRWMLNGASQERELKLPIKINAYATADAVIGKATRKARKWLHDTISGFEIPEGDVSDINPNTPQPILLEDLQLLYDMKKDALTEAERKGAETVLNNKREKDYQRLQTLLKSK
jgi:hypothetical protein